MPDETRNGGVVVFADESANVRDRRIRRRLRGLCQQFDVSGEHLLAVAQSLAKPPPLLVTKPANLNTPPKD